MEDLDRVAEVDVDRAQRRVLGAVGEPAARRLDEEVEQHGILAGRRGEHVAARAEPGEHRLGDERGEHRRQRGVHGVAAGAEDLRAGRSGDGVARGDDAAHRAQNLGMNSGTSTSMRESRSERRMRLTRGSPAGSRSARPPRSSARSRRATWASP